MGVAPGRSASARAPRTRARVGSRSAGRRYKPLRARACRAASPVAPRAAAGADDERLPLPRPPAGAARAPVERGRARGRRRARARATRGAAAGAAASGSSRACAALARARAQPGSRRSSAAARARSSQPAGSARTRARGRSRVRACVEPPERRARAPRRPTRRSVWAPQAHEGLAVALARRSARRRRRPRAPVVRATSSRPRPRRRARVGRVAAAAGLVARRAVRRGRAVRRAARARAPRRPLLRREQGRRSPAPPARAPIVHGSPHAPAARAPGSAAGVPRTCRLPRGPTPRVGRDATARGRRARAGRGAACCRPAPPPPGPAGTAARCARVRDPHAPPQCTYLRGPIFSDILRQMPARGTIRGCRSAHTRSLIAPSTALSSTRQPDAPSPRWIRHRELAPRARRRVARAPSRARAAARRRPRAPWRPHADDAVARDHAARLRRRAAVHPPNPTLLPRRWGLPPPRGGCSEPAVPSRHAERRALPHLRVSPRPRRSRRCARRDRRAPGGREERG